MTLGEHDRVPPQGHAASSRTRLVVIGVVVAVVVAVVVGGVLWLTSGTEDQSTSGRFAPDGWQYLVVEVATDGGGVSSEPLLSAAAVLVRSELGVAGVSDTKLRLEPGRAVIAVPPDADLPADLNTGPPDDVSFRPVLTGPVPGDDCAATGLVCGLDGTVGYELDDPLLDATGIAGATAESNPNGGWIITISFTRDGQTAFTGWSESNQGEELAVVVDGAVVAAPTIQGRIDGDAQIAGDFTKDQAERLAAQVKLAAASATWTVDAVGLDPPD